MIRKSAANPSTAASGRSNDSCFRVVVFGMFTVVFGMQLLMMQKQNSGVRIIEHRQAVENEGSFGNAVGASASASSLASPLFIPQGEAKALPSIRVEKEEEANRNIHGLLYGGQGDKQHLGGFTLYDGQGVSPATWKYMIQDLGVKSIMDIGCGKGVSTLWFHIHGVDVLCLEGSHDAVSQSVLPDAATQVVEHDFSRGPYWPGKTYDAVWCVEFLEHVGRNYQYNYVQAMRKAALIFVTHSRWGGWHHVEVHDSNFWINKMESFGFRYSDTLTKHIRDGAIAEAKMGEVEGNIGPDGKGFNAQHVRRSMLVFINPVVASLPEHSHLFSTPGCFKDYGEGNTIINRPCGTGKSVEESKLPDSYLPLVLTPEQDEKWLKRMQEHISSQKAKHDAGKK